MKTVFVIDLDRCIGCKGCEVACKMENDIGLGVNRNIVYQVGPVGRYPDLEMYFLPVMCQQCENPACVSVCPTGACTKNPQNDAIELNQEQCISCGRCQKACPYGAIEKNRELRVMEKCNLCMSADEAPACVRNCAGSALAVGDLDDPDSTVCRMIEDAGPQNVHQLRDFGNHPTTRYILRSAAWQDVMPQDCTLPGRRGRTGYFDHSQKERTP